MTQNDFTVKDINNVLVVGNLWSGRISFVDHLVIFNWQDLTENQREMVELGEVAAINVFRKLTPLSQGSHLLEEKYGRQRSL